jgi:sodium-dependent dicarboxylate transporter 2/3/5
MALKSKWLQLGIAVALGIVVMLLPRPEGTRFKVSGENIQDLPPFLVNDFKIESATNGHELILTARNPGEPNGTAPYIASKIAAAGLKEIEHHCSGFGFGIDVYA